MDEKSGGYRKYIRISIIRELMLSYGKRNINVYTVNS